MVLNKKSRQVWEQVSGILLSDSVEMDANEHVGLLTVMGGMRSVALFLDIPDTNMTRLLPPLRLIRLIPLLASGPGPAYRWDSPHPPEITEILRVRSRDSALWVCRNQEDARTIRNGVDQVTAGRLLGYPQCCIDAEQREQASHEDALVRGWTRKFGNDREKIASAWSEDQKVGIEFEDSNRVPRTMALFPFVQHTACESCLTLGNTPTAVLNAQYGAFVADVDPMLHEHLMYLGKCAGEQFPAVH